MSGLGGTIPSWMKRPNQQQPPMQPGGMGQSQMAASQPGSNPMGMMGQPMGMMGQPAPQQARNIFQPQSKYQCVCNQQPAANMSELVAHSSNCQQMQQIHGSLVDKLKNSLQNSFTDTALRNMQVILNAFSKEIENRISNPGNRDGSFPPQHIFQPVQAQLSQQRQAPPKISPLQTHKSNRNEPEFMDEEEDKRMEEDKDAYMFGEMQKQIAYETCKVCNKTFSPQEEQKGEKIMLVESGCYHFMHKSCLVELIFRNPDNVKCAECEGPIMEMEQRQYLTNEQMEKLEGLQLQKLVRDNPNLIQCACNNIIEIVAGKPDLNAKDEQGKKLTQAAAVHMAKFRVRCNKCEKNFCAGCSQEPYHLGKTCEEFKSFKEARKCRYCDEKITQAPPSAKPAFRDVCRKQDCMNFMNETCEKVLPCGHPCNGFRGEADCIPCMHLDCAVQNKVVFKDVSSESFCPICYCEGLGAQPCVRLDCGHIFHVNCVMKKVKNRWPGPRIVFGFLDCSQCRGRIRAGQHPALTEELMKSESLEVDIKKKALERAKFEGLDKEPRLKKQGDPYYNDLQKYAIASLAYYMCFKCKEPYFGGKKNCEQNNEEVKESFKPEELVCGKCAAQTVGVGQNNCKQHGHEYIEFKCKFCCNIAQWFCWGSTHFCESCHTRQNKGDYVSRIPKKDLPQCPGPEKCPLAIKHPPNGDEYALGCSICRNAVANAKNF